MGHYVIASPEEKQQMLARCGMKEMLDLYKDAPQELIVKKLNIPAGKSELEVRDIIEGMAAKNKVFKHIFRGAGAYDHYIPAIVKQVTAKEEFVTAYTPYQAEISQGILQSIFEYQTMICELTGLDVANASLYDGASGVAEATIMCKTRKKNKALLSGALNPDYIATAKTYNHSANNPLEIVPLKDGKTDLDALKAMFTEDASCIVVQQPNYFGLFEDCDAIAKIAHDAGAKFVMCVNPTYLGAFKTPAEYGADVAVGEGQPLGMPLSFGGPYLGFLAVKEDMTRQVVGRIVGETVDAQDRRGYVLTLQAREQHIKREKASSSICSNEALCALTASVYLAAMGPVGMKDLADQCYAKAHYLAGELAKIGFKGVYGGDFYQEFVTECPCEADGLLKYLGENDILGGLPLEGGKILWCCTEKNSKAAIDELVALCAKYVKEVAK